MVFASSDYKNTGLIKYLSWVYATNYCLSSVDWAGDPVHGYFRRSELKENVNSEGITFFFSAEYM